MMETKEDTQMAERQASERRLPIREPSMLDSYWKKKLAPQFRKNRLRNEQLRKTQEARRDAE